MRPQTGRSPIARPLAGGEVLVAVRGPSPGEGGGKNVSKMPRYTPIRVLLFFIRRAEDLLQQLPLPRGDLYSF